MKVRAALMNRTMTLTGAAILTAGFTVAVAPSAQAGYCDQFANTDFYARCVSTLGPQCNAPQTAGIAQVCEMAIAQLQPLVREAEYEKCKQQYPTQIELMCANPNAPVPDEIPEYVEPTWERMPNS